MIKILLINPCLRPESPVKIIPVGLACIATTLDKAGYKPDILDIDLYRYTDAEIENILAKNKYDLIGLGNIVSSYKISKKLCKQVKRVLPEAILVVGNTVASVPNILLTCVPEVDIAVIGEGDRTIVDIVDCLKNGKSLADIPGIAFRHEGNVIVSEKRKAIPNIEDVPFPDYSLFDFEKYLEVSYMLVAEPLPLPKAELRVVPLNTARGCPFDCTFCTHAFKGDKYRYYPFQAVIKRMSCLQMEYNANYLAFWDELTLNTRKRAVELCNAIEKEEISFFWSVNPRGNLFRKEDLDLLRRCKDLGALTIGGALESGSQEILTAMNKHLKPEEFVEQMNTAQKAGLSPLTSVVFGYPQETRETILMTFDICQQAGVYPSAGFVLPLPGTHIYSLAQKKGLIKDEEEYLLRIGDRQDLHVNLTHMSDQELIDTVTEGLIRLKDELNIPLSDNEVIKTTTYRMSKNPN